jgi:hypothetical protein
LKFIDMRASIRVLANKTLYVRDSDIALWDLAQTLLGESISVLFAEFLRSKLKEVKTMNAFVHVLRSQPNSQDLAVMFAPVGPTGSGGPGKPGYINEHQLVSFLEANGVTASVAAKIALDLRGAQSVSELTVMRQFPKQLEEVMMTVPEQVSAFLNAKKSAAFCDQCITSLLGLKRHQQAQQATTGGAAAGGFIRESGTCSNCKKNVIVTHA